MKHALTAIAIAGLAAMLAGCALFERDAPQPTITDADRAAIGQHVGAITAELIGGNPDLNVIRENVIGVGKLLGKNVTISGSVSLADLLSILDGFLGELPKSAAGQVDLKAYNAAASKAVTR